MVSHMQIVGVLVRRLIYSERSWGHIFNHSVLPTDIRVIGTKIFSYKISNAINGYLRAIDTKKRTGHVVGPRYKKINEI